jgi:hypothetical protein
MTGGGLCLLTRQERKDERGNKLSELHHVPLMNEDLSTGLAVNSQWVAALMDISIQAQYTPGPSAGAEFRVRSRDA